MPNIDDMFPSKYLKASSDFQPGQEFLVTIRDVVQETMQDGAEKWVVYLEKTSKGLVLNQTNGVTIASFYGKASEGWIGKQIVLYSVKVQGPQGIVDGIRVRAPQGNGAAQQPMAPAQSAPAPPDEDDLPF